jgi:subtilisin family serine protease
MHRHGKVFRPRAGLRVLAIAGMIALISASFATPVTARAPRPEGRIAGVRTLDGMPALPAPSRALGVHPKLDAVMSEIARVASSGTRRVASVASARTVRYEGGRVQAIVSVDAGQAARVSAAIRAARGTVTSGTDTQLQAWVSPRSLDRLARSAAVRGIAQPQAPTLLAGTSLTEGLAAMTNSGSWHTAGFDGTGVKVAIVDGGFIGYTNRQSSGDLPASLTIKNTVDGETDPQINTGTQHGTGVAEIVHDVAPGASLWLVKVGTQIDLAEAVDYLKLQDVDIITTSLGWFNLTPGDGTGFFDQQVDEARAAGILWTTAAANSRENYWDGTFSEGNVDNDWHSFNANAEFNVFGGTSTTCLALNPGFGFSVYLSWNDWTNVVKDYDLYVYRLNDAGTAWVQIGTSQNNQNGPFLTPTEQVLAVTSGNPTCYAYSIHKFAGGAADLRVHTPNWIQPRFFDNARSLSNLADAPAAMTVAALNAQDGAYPQEPYSSEGPLMGPGGSIAGGARGMDISGYANVDTEAYGPNTFNGTSAATPHVAGAAALVMDANPTFTLAQVESFLAGRAQDKGVAGADPLFGLGRLRLGAPPVPGPQPDGRIRVGTSGAFIGNDVYNTTGTSQSVSRSAPRGTTITFSLSIQNDGVDDDHYDVQGAGSSTHYTVKYFDGVADVTSQVVAGTFLTPPMTEGSTHVLTVKVKVKSTAPAGSKVGRLVTITSNDDGTKKDAVKFVAKRS